MCIRHLLYYRENKIHILENFLKAENKNTDNSNNSSKLKEKLENKNPEISPESSINQKKT